MQKGQQQKNNKLVKSSVKPRPKKVITRLEKQPTFVWKVPDCAEHYFGALVNPFDSIAGACVPCDLFPLPSQKIRSFIRQSVQIGAQGIGYIIVTPVGANDVTCCRTTTATSAGDLATAMGAFSNLALFTMPQIPYKTSDLTGSNTPVAARVVGLGVRVKYIGQLLNRNGFVTAFEDPDHRDVSSRTPSLINASNYSEIRRVDSDEWDIQTCWSGPVTPVELEFVNNTVLSAEPNCMVIVLNGTAGDKYEFELVQHTEFIGTTVPSKTKSHSEPSSFGKIVENTKDFSMTGPIQKNEIPSVWERIKNALSQNLPAYWEVAKGATKLLTGDVAGGGSLIFSGIKQIDNGERYAARGYDQKTGREVKNPLTNDRGQLLLK